MENVKILNQDHFGRGVAKIDGKTYFVEYALPGESVDIEIVKDKSKYTVAKVKDFVNKTDCPYYLECGGCYILHQNYQEQLKFKENKVKEIVTKYLDDSIKINNIIYNNQYNYRNKIVLHANGKKLGLYKSKSNDITEINKCLLVDDKINKVITELNKYFEKYPFTGEIKIRVTDNEVMLSTTEDVNKNIKDFVNVDVLIINEEYLTDKKYLISTLENLKFKISDKSFYQVNIYNTINLYNQVINFYKENNYKTVLDLFSGTGTITLLVSKYVETITGIEIIKDAVDDANFNKKLNKIENANFICGKVEDYIDKFKDIDSIIVDPPRSGLDNKTIENILRIKPKSICYVSCEVNTLVRDLKLLNDNYEIINITPVDMFPNTYHVECVAILKFKNN